jgi:hypothetical protein
MLGVSNNYFFALDSLNIFLAQMVNMASLESNKILAMLRIWTVFVGVTDFSNRPEPIPGEAP